MNILEEEEECLEGRLLRRLPELNLTKEQLEKVADILGADTITDGEEIVGFAWPQ